jgi:DnaJ-domain-containing protein 1
MGACVLETGNGTVSVLGRCGVHIELLAWLDVLDSVTYYEILNVDAAAGHDEIKEAFHVFAAAFHPDAHAMSDGHEQRAAHMIFKRGVEAYRVLLDPSSRATYDAAIDQGEVRPATLSSMRPPPPPPREDTFREDQVALSARPFARRAEELAKTGEFGQAKLYLNLALFHDPTSDTLLAFRTFLERMAAEKG